MEWGISHILVNDGRIAVNNDEDDDGGGRNDET